MNISNTTIRLALIPVEREIMKKPVEYAVAINKNGKQRGFIGNESHVDTKPRWYKIFFPNDKTLTHNHPKAKKNTLSLSLNDMFHGIEQGFQEVRALSEDGYCALVEIPKMGIFKKFKLLNKLKEYDKNLSKGQEETEKEAIKRIGNSLKMTIDQKVEEIVRLIDSYTAKNLRNVRKILEKEGFKFRTIKLP